jgi:hypothetical protein
VHGPGWYGSLGRSCGLGEPIGSLAINTETVRSVVNADLAIAQGGRINPTVGACETECIPEPTLRCDTSRLVICGCA